MIGCASLRAPTSAPATTTNFRSPGFDLRLGPITIGPDAWIAARAVLAPGTVIGPGAVVALGAVVSGTVPPGAIVRGNPAVVVGER